MIPIIMMGLITVSLSLTAKQDMNVFMVLGLTESVFEVQAV